jgi:DNA-3-methyladenine glycosylase I
MCNRCSWSGSSDIMIEYHDTEWGVPLHDDGKLFEFLILEGFQAGLSWQIILNKRQNFRKAFCNFNPQEIVKFDDRKVFELLEDKSIVRNRQKITACINNASRFLEIQEEFGSFDKYIWAFTGNKTIVNTFKKLKELPAKTPLSDEIAKDMKKRGFKFTGSTVIYAHMQATGMVNDHLVSCFRFNEINNLYHESNLS